MNSICNNEQRHTHTFTHKRTHVNTLTHHEWITLGEPVQQQKTNDLSLITTHIHSLAQQHIAMQSKAKPSTAHSHTHSTANSISNVMIIFRVASFSPFASSPLTVCCPLRSPSRSSTLSNLHFVVAAAVDFSLLFFQEYFLFPSIVFLFSSFFLVSFTVCVCICVGARSF